MYTFRIDKPRPEYIEYNGVKYRLSLYFDRVIRFYELMRSSDTALSQTDKLEVAYDWFVSSPGKAAIFDKLAVVDIICRDCLSDKRAEKIKNENKRTAFNYISDSAYIYADFRRFYNIDLFECQGKLTWWEFRAMFDALPSDSKMKEIMCIRTRKLPESNRFNTEEIIRIKKQQEYYFLPENWEEVRRESEEALSGIFDMLLDQAKGGTASG